MSEHKTKVLERQVAALLDERDKLKDGYWDEAVKLRAFAKKMLEGWPEDFGDVDGCTIQDAAIECGLLEGETRHEPCGEGCNCASYHGDMSGGVTCYRRTALLMGPNVKLTGVPPTDATKEE